MCLSIGGNLGCSRDLVIVTKAAGNMGLHVFFVVNVSLFFWINTQK